MQIELWTHADNPPPPPPHCSVVFDISNSKVFRLNSMNICPLEIHFKYTLSVFLMGKYYSLYQI